MIVLHSLRKEAIRELLDLSDHLDWPCGQADAIAQRQLEQIEQRLARLDAVSTGLTRMVQECAGGRAADRRVLEVLRDHLNA
jgi:hypothetical protein